jgi:hypothetical protein
MKELKCDMIVGPITTIEKEDENVYTVPLTGKTDDAEVKLTVKFKDRMDMKDYGIDEVGNRKTVMLKPTNSTLSDFSESVD